MSDFEKAKQFFIEGLHALEKNNFQAAETQFAQSLAIIPDRVSTLNNLAAVKIRLKKFKEAEKFARRAIGLEITSPEAWLNLSAAWSGLEKLEDLENPEEALRACEQALTLDAGPHQVLYAKSLVLKRLHQLEAAETTYKKAIEARVAASPIFVTARHSTQRIKILVINQNPAFNRELKSFEVLHTEVNFPGQLARVLHEDCHFSFIFESSLLAPAIRAQIPTPDFIINNNANGEKLLSGDDLSEFIAAVDSFGVPVVNHPDKATQTTRDASVKYLQDVPGILLPKTRRFSSAGKAREELIREIEAQYEYPLITRTLAAQEGKGMTKVDSREALVAVLSAASFPETFFVTAFVDSRHGQAFYRKIRAAIVQDDIIFVRVDSDTNWNVHGRKSDERVRFYLENPALLEQEKQICADPAKMLGASVMQALRAMRGRIPLDIFGVDFDVAADGRLVFYEANATMNLFSTAREEVPHPKRADDTLKLAFQRYFTTLVK